MAAQLNKHLRFWDSIAISIGIVIGVGIFRTPGQIAKYLDSPSAILIAWLIGGLISLLGVFCYAELSSKFPQTGGTYIFLREAYGKFTGFIYGWAEFSINRAATIAAVAYILATYLRALLPYPSGGEKWVAISAVIFFTWINMIGVHFGVKMQHVLSSFKVLAIVAIAGLIFWFSKSSFQFSPDGFQHINLGRFHNLAPALIPILWTYGGWHESTFLSGEFHDTRKELPYSLILSALLVTGLYLLINAAYLSVLSPAEMTGSKAIASDALKKLFGPAGSMIVTAAILMSASGALNSNIMTGGRIPFAVAKDCPRLAWIGHVDSQYKTPVKSLLLNAGWACVLILWGNFEQILFFNAFEIWLFFILIGIGVFILRGKSDRDRSKEFRGPVPNFPMIGYPFVPLAFTAVSIWLCATTVLEAPREALFGALIILTGVPIYFGLRKSSDQSDKSVVE